MENIEVAVRLRPLNSKELEFNEDSAWRIESNQKTIVLCQQQ